MAHEPHPEASPAPRRRDHLPETGALVHEDKQKLERAVAEKLRTVGKWLTQKEISALMTEMETTNSLEGLRSKIAEKSDSATADEIVKEILRLYESVRNAAKEGIRELRINVSTLQPEVELEPKDGLHFSQRFPWVRALEKSELGKKPLLDLVALPVGLADSLVSFVQILLGLLWDVPLVFKHAFEDYRSAKGESSSPDGNRKTE